MNSSNFMDKQIMDLSRSKTSNSNDDFIDLMNPIPANDDDNNEDNTAQSADAANKEDILPNYDFQPIRPVGLPSRSSDSLPMGGGTGGSASLKPWNSADSKSNSSPTRSYGYLGSVEPDKAVLEKAHNVSDVSIVSEIDRTMKRYADNIMHAIDGLSARLSQLESRTRQVEHSVDDLKVSIGNNNGSSDGKMRQLENILRELQSCVVDLKDKQDVMNARIQLEKLQISEVHQTPETHNRAHISPPQQSMPAPQQSNQQFPVASLQSLPGVSPNAPPPPPQQSINPPMLLPNQYHPPTPVPAAPQGDTYFPPPGQTQEAPSQQYPAPASQPQSLPAPQFGQEPPSQQYAAPPAQPQQSQSLPPPQHQQYQPTPPTPYPHGPQLPHQQFPPHPVAALNPPPPQLQQPPMAHHSEEVHIPSQTYPAGIRQPPPQQLYGSAPPSHMYDSPTGRSGSGFSSSVYNPPTGPSEPSYPYSGSSSHYGNNPGTKLPSHSSGGNYPQIPTARVLPQAIPTATSVGGGGSSGGSSGNRVPVDDVIDKVTNMGFSREQVRATVRKLTENGQPVDLNVVLDKLMNDSDVQPPRGWFGR